MKMLSKSFMADLKGGGLLGEMLKRVKQDDTLMLAIRNDYINIYYRGGNLIRIKEQSANQYEAYFDPNYCVENELPNVPKEIKRVEDAKKWVKALPQLKEMMDFFFTNIKSLRENFNSWLLEKTTTHRNPMLANTSSRTSNMLIQRLALALIF